MDNTREKLIELVNAVLRCLPWGEISSHTAKEIADHLVANGVTFATDNNVGDKSSPTNEDRLRAMSIEELLNWFGDACPPNSRCAPPANCDACWRKWLQQPAEVDNG